jgi:hypothetical protein
VPTRVVAKGMSITRGWLCNPILSGENAYFKYGEESSFLGIMVAQECMGFYQGTSNCMGTHQASSNCTELHDVAPFSLYIIPFN